ncbi:hypothetical protein [Proteus mirabilis]|uniref:hypothetical protein n=1 Tax=Proteus mirabilis TaxID=584 RepID=UPI0034D499CB
MTRKLKPVRSVDKRSSNRYIVITHIRSFSVRLNPLRADLMRFTKGFVFNKITDYFFENLEKRQYPFHFYVSKMRNDWITMVGAPLTQRSELMEEAVKFKYIPSIFKNAIVVAVQDDLDIRIPEGEMYDVINNQICVPLFDTFKMGNYFDSIFFLDEIFDYPRYEKDLKNYDINPSKKYRFDMRPMRYFDRTVFNLSFRGQL